jgi:hypothetical protein
MDIDPETIRKVAQAQGIRLGSEEAGTVSASLASLAPARRLADRLSFEEEPATFHAILAREERR